VRRFLAGLAVQPAAELDRMAVGDARGHEVVHLIRPGEREAHGLFAESEIREGTLYVCGAEVA
jgi:hypothetical protein